MGRGTNTIPTEAVNALTPYAVAGDHNFSSVAGSYSSVIGVLAGAPSAGPAPATPPADSTTPPATAEDSTGQGATAATSSVPVGAIAGAAAGAGEGSTCSIEMRSTAVGALCTCTQLQSSGRPPYALQLKLLCAIVFLPAASCHGLCCSCTSGAGAWCPRLYAPAQAAAAGHPGQAWIQQGSQHRE